MLNVIYFIIGLCITGKLLFVAEANLSLHNFIPTCLIATIVFAIWGAGVIISIRDIIEKQLKDKHSIPRLEKRKLSFADEMAAYKEEMQEELLEKYRKFESTLMNSIKDSHLIAAILKQNDYSSVLRSYDGKIKWYLDSIHSCDRELEYVIQAMKVRQENPIYGYSLFLPKSLFYYDEEKI